MVLKEQEVKISAKEDFAKWACGYSGFDGGNPWGKIWFCGIEYGAGYKKDELESEIKKGSEEALFIPKGDKGFIRPQFNYNLVKLYSSILGVAPAKYKEVFEKTSTFDKNSDTFKLNLYPIAFKDTTSNRWEEWHYKITGLWSKSLYGSWCQLSRFLAINGWVGQYNPKVIICTGTTYAQEFMMAFSGIEDTFKVPNHVPLEKKGLKWAAINSEKTLLFVVPFPGRGKGGLNSDKGLFAFGTEIKKIADSHFGSPWHKEYQLD